MNTIRFYIILILAISIFSCVDEKNKNVLEKETFEGPSIEMDSVTLIFSDSVKVKIKLKAPKQLILDNDDREFPDGIYLEFFDKNEEISSILVGDRGYYIKKENHYKAEGNVLLYNVVSKDELSTEELIWEPDEEKVHTDKFVTIKSEDEIHTGEGLTADQDFESYTILNPSGTLSIDEQF
ncbi:LPS export ABC transporter periplasmic protein LptC [Reichenbachiella sp. MALMAid0571]|uniref:LPS export ABC transporter periplasmic protein LptC n=1 Tax=Reichenbachiella sp. MALMAid0571 TaxID=3143939 RepID=UPI0032DEF400